MGPCPGVARTCLSRSRARHQHLRGSAFALCCTVLRQVSSAHCVSVVTNELERRRVRNSVPVLVDDRSKSKTVIDQKANLRPLSKILDWRRLELTVHGDSWFAAIGAGSRGPARIGNALERLAAGEADVGMKIASHQLSSAPRYHAFSRAVAPNNAKLRKSSTARFSSASTFCWAAKSPHRMRLINPRNQGNGSAPRPPSMSLTTAVASSSVASKPSGPGLMLSFAEASS